MKDRDIDDVLDRAAKADQVDEALLARVTTSIGASLHPVRPIQPAWMMASILLLIAAAIAVASGLALGMWGIQKMDAAQIGGIFPALVVFSWLAALSSVASVTPGGLRWKNPSIMGPVMTNPAMLLLVVVLVWIAIDAIFFHDYAMRFFVAEGIPCLRAGLLIAMPVGIGAWLVLRRGFAVNRAAAGIAAGTLAGLAGLIMLELHCPNFHAVHVMFWHSAVVPVSALAGAMLTRITAAK